METNCPATRFTYLHIEKLLQVKDEGESPYHGGVQTMRETALQDPYASAFNRVVWSASWPACFVCREIAYPIVFTEERHIYIQEQARAWWQTETSLKSTIFRCVMPCSRPEVLRLPQSSALKNNPRSSLTEVGYKKCRQRVDCRLLLVG
jgi:hypothetical protein